MAERTPLTKKDVCETYAQDGYSGSYASASPGMMGILKAYLQENDMYTSTATTNQERWERIVRDAVPSQQSLAKPEHYKSLPKHQRFRSDFQLYFTVGERFYHNQYFQWSLAFIVCSIIHYVSTQLYATPLPIISRWSCSAFPSQAHCSFLWLPMKSTFNLLTDDLAKFFTTAVVHRGIQQLTEKISPFKPKRS